MPTKRVFVICAAIAIICAGASASHAETPSYPVEDLTGRDFTLPVADTDALYIVSFSRESTDAARRWREALTEAAPGVDIYSVIVLEGAPFFVRGMVKRGVRSDLPEAQHPFFVTTTKNADDWRALSGSRDDALPIVFCYPKQATVEGAVEGEPTAEHLEALATTACMHE